MKQAWWKRILSHFMSFSIEKAPSTYSKELEVRYTQGRYSLCTENAIYSYEDLYVNFRDSFQQINWEHYKIQKVLLLGLGLGSVPLLLEQSFNKNFQYTAVEIDPVVISFAKKYGLGTLHSPIDLICTDAHSYVMQSKDQFDLIIVDLFIDTEVPLVFEHPEWVRKLKTLMSSEGLLMYNRMTLTEETQAQTQKFFNSTFKKVFPKADFLEIRGNRMLLSSYK